MKLLFDDDKLYTQWRPKLLLTTCLGIVKVYLRVVKVNFSTVKFYLRGWILWNIGKQHLYGNLKKVCYKYSISTTLWYINYQTLVLQVPRSGISCTKHWYFNYQALVLTEYPRIKWKSDDQKSVVTVYKLVVTR